MLLYDMCNNLYIPNQDQGCQNFSIYVALLIGERNAQRDNNFWKYCIIYAIDIDPFPPSHSGGLVKMFYEIGNVLKKLKTIDTKYSKSINGC